MRRSFILNRFFMIFALFSLLVTALFLFNRSTNPPVEVGGYWVLDQANNRPLTHTSFPLRIGDEYISANNKIYRIISISGNRAYARMIGTF